MLFGFRRQRIKNETLVDSSTLRAISAILLSNNKLKKLYTLILVVNKNILVTVKSTYNVGATSRL